MTDVAASDEIGRKSRGHGRAGRRLGVRPRSACAPALLPALLAGAALTGCGASSGPPSTTPQGSLAPATAPATTASKGTSTAAPAPTTGPPTAPTTAAAAAGTAACGWTAFPPPTYQHIIWIWMENHQWSQVLGRSSPAPYARSLGAQCGTATDYASVASPSLPNYLGATSGSTQGIGDDNPPPSHPLTADNLFRQVRGVGGSARSYEEAMTQPCQLSSAGRYAVKHNPAAYYVGGTDRTACQSDDVPFSLAQNLAAVAVPTFAFLTPDLCHDTHDCGVSAGDAYLAQLLPGLLASPAYRAGTTAIFVIWDEYTPMPNLVIAPSVRPGTVAGQPLDHYALLRTTEELLGLPGRLGAAARAASLRGPFNL